MSPPRSGVGTTLVAPSVEPAPPRAEPEPRPLRILHVLEPGIGGVPEWVRLVSGAQRAMGHEVRQFGGPESHDPRFATSWRRPDRFTAALRAVRRTVQEFRPDVVHTHSFFGGLTRRLDLGDALVAHQPHCWVGSRAGGRGDLIGMAAERSLARRTDIVLYADESEADVATEHSITTPSTTVGVPYDVARFVPVTAPRSPDRPVVLCVGRIARQKGQDLIVPRWEEAIGSAATLVLLGGEASGQLSPNVRVEPMQDPRAWIARASLAVAPSRWEGRSIAVVELLASGIPVVSFDLPSMRHLLTERGMPPAGAVVDQFDVDALLGAVGERLDRPDLLTRESVAGPRRVIHCRPAVVADAVVRAYRTALEPNRVASAMREPVG
ncbi:glycosyltransferase involved in cell wall biosynthesis [Ilumatobacter fluminis]|uniref:Glycosyltransferase involved in cell wall biosynthesis n=1 Tax=Ilumatobacter fluminis TaxID=467091 RepID=A0A4R7I4N5_9ACTN|nr:glycosyltransferase family 4 protein [Ilumatobacter fluminis]TDT18485.1 glycosyltransferase involved in cell wall biosynthesis [Ilumatobacter fluminis]